MPARWTAGLALAALALGAHARAAPRAQTVLAHCAAQSAKSVGLSALRTACPGVGRALQRLHLTSRLPAGWRHAITPADLSGLAQLTQRYAGAPARWLPDAPLRHIARDLKPPRPPPDAWSRFVRWVRHRLSLLLHRVRRWLDSLALGARHSGLAPGLVFALAAAVLLAIVTAALLQLRAVRRSRRTARAQAGSGEAPIIPSAGLPEGEADWGGLGHHPAAWLRALVAALSVSRRLEVQRALTCRELALRAHFDSEAQRADFQRIAELAERELYGPGGTGAVPEESLHRARALHAELSLPARAAGTRRS